MARSVAMANALREIRKVDVPVSSIRDGWMEGEMDFVVLLV